MLRVYLSSLSLSLAGVGLALNLWLFSARIAHDQLPSEAWFGALRLDLILIFLGVALMQLPANRAYWARKQLGLFTALIIVVLLFSLTYWLDGTGQFGFRSQARAIIHALLAGAALLQLARCARGDSPVQRRFSWLQQTALAASALMAGAILLAGLVSEQAAPVIGKIAVALIFIAVPVQAFADIKSPAVINRSNSLTLVKIAMYSVGFAMPFVMVNLTLKLALVASVLSFIGLLLQRFLLFREASLHS